MPWSKKTKGKNKHFRNLRKISKRAEGICNVKIKNLVSGQVAKYSGFLTYNIVYKFSREKKVSPHVILLILIIDFYEAFCRDDAWMWGFIESDPRMILLFRTAVDEGYIEKNGIGRSSFFHHTLKGKKLVEEYDIFYVKRVKQILKSNSIGNTDLKYRFKNVRPKTPGRNRRGYNLKSVESNRDNIGETSDNISE